MWCQSYGNAIYLVSTFIVFIVMLLLTCASNLFFKFLHLINYLQYANHNDQGFINILKTFGQFGPGLEEMLEAAYTTVHRSRGKF